MEWGITEYGLMAGALFLGGIVKGTFGIGLPMVATSVLALFLDVPQAIVLMTLPMVLSNIWQAYRDGGVAGLRRFWPLLVAIIPGTWVATEILFMVDSKTLVFIMGGSLAFFSGLQLTPFRLKVPPGGEVWMGPLVGLFAGLIGGLTTFFGAVIAMYLLVLKMERDEFIGAIGLIYAFCSLLLLSALTLQGAVGVDVAKVSLGLCVPMFIGLAAGQHIRRHLKQEMFFKYVSVFLILIGLSLIFRNLAF